MQQIRNMNTVNTDDAIFYDHADLEKVFRHDDETIKRWINKQLEGLSSPHF